jgi:tRNA 2-(methylsulfanyl)-N6-isopentenyladenosine37 hydroxylase
VKPVRELVPVLEFLPCRTPAAWIDAAMSDLPTLLLDHAALELKAAQQAQTLIWRYAMHNAPVSLSPADLKRLRGKLSRLAREELRHFEQVLDILAARDIPFEPVSASRYAASLHREIADAEPERLVDTLIVCGIIEARSCERFHSLVPRLVIDDPGLAHFYGALLRAEARHFRDYLDLARVAADAPIDVRLAALLEIERRLVVSGDEELRFHSGVRGATA